MQMKIETLNDGKRVFKCRAGVYEVTPEHDKVLQAWFKKMATFSYDDVMDGIQGILHDNYFDNAIEDYVNREAKKWHVPFLDMQAYVFIMCQNMDPENYRTFVNESWLNDYDDMDSWFDDIIGKANDSMNKLHPELSIEWSIDEYDNLTDDVRDDWLMLLYILSARAWMEKFYDV